MRGIALQPFGNVEVEELLAPDHSGECLSLNGPRICALNSVLQARVELISLADARVEQRAEVCKRRRGGTFCQPKLNLELPPAGTRNEYQAAALVPLRSGLTASARPLTTRS